MQAGMRSFKMNLYWVETFDHDEDWFIVGRNEREAEGFHEGAEGYEVGDAKATFVAEVPDGTDAEIGWPSHELLEACGARIIRPETPRLVEIDGREFCEGLLEAEVLQVTDNQFEALGRGRPNRTKPRTMS
jgi:hypothetical protein